jgi:CheY-like chemotaxis protein
MSSAISSSRAVLLVDDNPDIFAMYRDVLPAMSNLIILTAENGVDALEQIEAYSRKNAKPLSCIVIDVMMPQLDGIQLVRALRGDPTTAEIPLVILTALAQDRQRFAGLASGADQYLTKPVSVPKLLAAIDTAIALSPDERLQQWRDLAESPEAEA